MNAMVLCAGYGTRLSPLTDSIPKPLVRVAGCTLLVDLLHHLAAQGVDRAVVNGSWKAEMLKTWLEETRLPLETIFQNEGEPLGTAGGVRRALPHLGEQFLVVYGDNLTRQPVAPLLELHGRTGAEVTVSLSPTGEPSSKGIVLTDPEGLVTCFREKPPDEVAESNLGNSGIYICRASVVNDLEDGEFCDFGHDLFPRMLREGRKIAADTTGGYIRDIGTVRSYLLACHDILSGRVVPYRLVPGMTEGMLIENDQSYEDIAIRGTYWAEKGCAVGKGCQLENCVVLSGARVGPGCRLRNTLVLPGSSVPEGTVADDKYLDIF
ncbi:MAG: NDP-sugar synthase [Candidatus Fermentibacteraceae bacterium]|nr:NDP-sugar synthase [Candidatus Fermentibacteraceae bacterium]MBN2609191.1 NDP-sugar synthase [Candidatus Fermentibacteraceae bacterium]